MRKVVLAVAIVATMSLSVFANTSKDKRSDRDRKSPMTELNLSAEQQTKMKALKEDHRTKRSELRENHKKEMQALLTPEQQSKWKEMHENKMKNKGRKDFAKKGDKGKKEDRRGKHAERKHGQKETKQSDQKAA